MRAGELAWLPDEVVRFDPADWPADDPGVVRWASIAVTNDPMWARLRAWHSWRSLWLIEHAPGVCHDAVDAERERRGFPNPWLVDRERVLST